MCLYVKKGKFELKIAQEDIVVYKILAKRTCFIISPYQGFVYEIGKKYKTRIEPQFHGTYYSIGKGFHSFLREEDVWSEKMRIQDFNSTYGCFRCVIPKGSHIVYGTYGSKDSVVSEAIKVVEEV